MFGWLKQTQHPAEKPTPVGRFSARMVEPIRFETTTEQQIALLRAIGETGKEKAPIIRACIALALPALVANPDMIDKLQPGYPQSHNGSEKAGLDAV